MIASFQTHHLLLPCTTNRYSFGITFSLYSWKLLTIEDFSRELLIVTFEKKVIEKKWQINLLADIVHQQLIDGKQQVEWFTEHLFLVGEIEPHWKRNTSIVFYFDASFLCVAYKKGSLNSISTSVDCCQGNNTLQVTLKMMSIQLMVLTTLHIEKHLLKIILYSFRSLLRWQFSCCRHLSRKN